MQHNDYDMNRLRGDDDGSVVQSAPPTLLPTVLHELGLDSPILLGDQAVVAAGDGNWYKRAAAMRTLGKLGEQAPLEPLLVALEDDHEMVRATAVHAAGLLGERVPLEKIISALQDPAWHVREVAALTLGELGERVPLEPLLAALDDTVAPVREAARTALQQIHPDALLSPSEWISTEQPSSAQPSNGVAHSFPIQSQKQIWQPKPESSEESKDAVHLSIPINKRERTQRMKTLHSHSQAGKSFSRSLSIIAAIVLLCVIVGSLLFVLNIVRRNTTTGQPPTAPHLYVVNGSTIYKVEPASGKVIWKYTVINKNHFSDNGVPHPFSIQIPLTVVDGIVYFEVFNPPADTSLNALDATTGALRWHKQIDHGVGTPTVVNGVIYLCSDVVLNGGTTEYGKVYSLNASDGSERWHYQTPSLCDLGAVQDGAVYVSSSNSIDALSAAKGTLLWSTQVSGNPLGAPQLVDGVLYMESLEQVQNHLPGFAYVYAFNPANGNELWRSQRIDGYVVTPPTIVDGAIYLSLHDGTLYSLSATTGQYRWHTKVGLYIFLPSEEVNGVVYAIGINSTNMGTQMIALDAANGARRWSRVIDNYLAYALTGYDVPAINNGLIYFGTMHNHVFVLSATNGSVVKEYSVGNADSLVLPVLVAP